MTSSGGFRLSPQQRRLCQIQDTLGERPFRALALARIRGRLDLGLLREAVAEVVERFEILRTTFPSPVGLNLPVQEVADEATVAWYETRDFSGLAVAKRESALDELLAQVGEEPFDFSRGPLLRVAPAVLSEDENALALILPALCADAVTLRNLVYQIATSYAVLSGATDPEDSAPLQYIDLAEWQNELLEREETEVGREHWEAWDPSVCRALSLPFEMARTQGDRFEPRFLAVHLESELAQRAAVLATELNTSLPTLLLAAWQSLLWRLLGQPEIVLGLAAECRSYEGLSASLGPLASFVPLSCRLDGDLRFADAVAQARDAEQATIEWQEYFRWEAVAKRHLLTAEETIFPVSFTAQEHPAPWRAGPLEWTLPRFKAVIDRFRLGLTVRVEGGLPAVDLAWDSAVFSRDDAESLARAWRVLLGSAVARPETRLSELALTRDERSHLASVGTAGAAAEPLLVHELFVRQAQRVPDRTALVCAGRSLSYDEVAERTCRLARLLRRYGVGPDVLVALCLERSLAMPLAVLGVLRAGGAYLPLEPGLPLERKSFLLTDARPRMILTDTRFLAELPAADIPVLCLDGPWEAESQEAGSEPLGPAPDPANLVYVIYTSGSTGVPKGVAVEHRQLANYVQGVAERLDLPEGAVYAMVSTFAADLGNTVLFPSLCSGGTLHLIPDELTSDPVALAATLERDPVDCMKITPSHLEALMAGAPSPCLLPRRCLVLGGEASRREWVEGLTALQPSLRVMNHYGPTETTVGVLTHSAGPGLRTATLPLGRSLPGIRAWLLGPNLEPLPAWFPGELYLGGAGVSRGYLGRPDLTADRFVPAPLAGVPGARMYRTGDLARSLPDGNLEFIGRADNQVKIRGFRVELGEIETVLEGNPEVRRAAVAARNDNSGSRRLVAYVVARPATRVAELRERLREQLPEFMVPSVFVFLDALPLNANGKVDLRALPEPDWRHLATAEEFIAPETPTEQLLAQVWAEVLGVERVGSHDNFFLLGGDSIRAIVVRARAEEKGAGFSINQIFDQPVLRNLAREIEERGVFATDDGRIGPFALLTEADRVRLPQGVEDAYPLARLQAGMLFHSELAPGTAIYHDIHSYHVLARLDLGLLRKTLEYVAFRHPVLRTSFELAGYSEPLQLVHAGVVPPLEEHDLRALAAGDQEEAVRNWLRQERQRTFDWRQPPLISFHVHRRSDESFQFTISFHHSILDGWSSASLQAELFRRYLSLLDDADCAEEEPPRVTLSEFIHLERTVLASAEAREFWRRHLENSPVVRLPRRQTESGTAEWRAEYVDTPLPLDLSDGLKRVARSLSLPLKSVLMAVHFRVLGLLSGLTDVVSGVVSNGRPERTDGERAIGLFLNTLPLRMALPGGSWGDLAYAAYTLESESLPFRRFPLSELQHLEGGRLLFETAFNFLHFHVYDSLAQIPGIEVLSGEGYEETNFTLIATFHLSESPSQIHLRLSYQAAEHDREGLEEVARRYLSALEGMAASPQAPYDTWGLFTEAERAQLLAWNRTAHPMRLPLRVHEIFEAQAKRTPEATAAEMDAGQLTYRELDHRAERLARRLRAAGVGPDDPVGMCLDRSLAVPVAVLGILKAGGAYLPLDPAYPAERLAAMADDARLHWLVCDEKTLDRLPGGLREQSRILLLGPAGEMDGESGAQSEDMPAAVTPENLAYVLYTSGSTGRPKGVAMPHGPLANLIDWQIQATTAPGPLRTAQFSSLSFDVSFQEMFTAWAQGGTLVLLSEEVRRDPRSLLNLLTERSIQQLFLPFVALQQLADETAASGVFPTALREVITAGEQLQATAAVRELFRRLPGCRLVNAYGPTETHVVTAFILAESPDTWPTLPPIGRSIGNLWARALDASLQPVLPGVPGEIYFGGAGLARGYLGRPDLTAERFLPDPQEAEPGARVYRTGDLARYLVDGGGPDGEIEFLGRTDQQVKVRGFRVEPGEIEAALALHPGIREAAVVAREVSGPGDRRLIGYVVPRGRSAAEAGDALAGELRTFLAGRLPEHMVPWVFVLLDGFPLTPSGKLDRRNLPAPGAARRLGNDLATPRGPVEEILAGIWAELLGLEQVGAADNFFDLGGHSLLATRVMSRLRSAFDIELPLRDLFEAPTLADLAARVEMALGTGTSRLAPPLVPVASTLRKAPLPLSFAQQRLWFIDQLEPGRSLYNVPVALRAEGPLNSQVLALCLGEIVRRHEVLRTVFAMLGGSPVQVILPAIPFGLPVVDLSGLAESARETQALTLAGAEAGRPFDLACDPLLRGVLLRLAEEDHLVALTLHHIVSDGWSMGILVREVMALYAAFAEGRPSPLPELPVQYADFSAWQHSWLHGEILESEISYWRRQLAGLPPRLELPTDRPRPAVQSFHGASRQVRLSAEITRKAQALGRCEGATLFMVLLAGFQALLARYSGQEDLAVGTPVAGRNRVEIERLIGFFVNTLVLRGKLTGAPSFQELLGRVRETALAAHAHQDVAFERLVQELTPERSLAQTPLFQVMFVLQNAPVESLEIQNLRLRPVSRAGTTAKFDLTLTLEEWNGGLVGAVEHATDLFDSVTIDRLMIHYERLLSAALTAPELPVLELPLLSGAEHHQLLQEWNDTKGPLSREILLPSLLTAQAAQTPELPALVQGSALLTHGELAVRTDQLAAHLRTLGVGPDVLVALFLERSIDLVVALIAVLKAGGAYLPLEVSHPRDRLSAILDDARMPLLLTRTRLLPALPEHSACVVCLDGLREGAALAGPVVQPDADNLAYALYTSGSTGKPKGVAVTHRGLTNYLLWAADIYPAGEGRGAPVHSPVSFDLTVTSLFLPLLSGRCVFLVPEEDGVPGLTATLAEGGFGLVKLTPAHLDLLRCMLPPERVSGCASAFVIGGEPLSGEQVAFWREHAPGLRLINEYGPTETVVGCCVYEIPASAAPAVSIGRPIANTRLQILDPRLRPVPAGVPGELYIGGAGVCRGYLHRPDLTAEKLVPDPFGTAGERLYRTGDLARYLPDGTIDFLGRIDNQVKIRGFRIELGEIEEVLAAVPGVREAIVVAREDRPGDRRLVAYVVGDVGTSALRLSLQGRLPDYMVPAAFVTLAALPLTPNGKVDRKALPVLEQKRAEQSYLAPRTPVEEVLAGIWAELLGLDRVGADDHFFNLGGHSLLATQVMSRLRAAFGVELPLRDLFEAPALADLAARVEATRRAGTGRLAPPLVPIAPALREGPLPLSFAQQRLWFIDQLEPGSPLYNMPVALHVEGPLDSQVLALCLGEIVRRHEALRTVFAARDGSPVQVIRSAAPFGLTVIDLSGLPERKREVLALTLAGEEAIRPFDLACGPLLRGLLLRLAQEDHVATLTLHHIVSDGWSMGVLVREVTALYAAFAERRISPLPELPVQYADYAAWQSSWLHGDIQESETSFWRRQLAGLPPRLELPTDRPRPAVQSFRGASRPVWLPAELTLQAQALSRSEGATLFMVLLTGFLALLARYSRQNDIAVGTPVAGRNRLEIEGLIGFFVNTLVLRGNLTDNPSFRELLRQVRETALAAHMHQDVPFENLVQELSPERSLAQTPLFQVMFVLQNNPVESVAIQELRLRPIDVAGTTSKFDLTLALQEWNGGLSGMAEHSTDLFDATTIERLIAHYDRLLNAALAAPELSASELPLLTGAERHQLVAEWGGMGGQPPAAPTLHSCFEAQARQAPDAPALTCGDATINYDTLNRRSNQLACWLRSHGVGPESRVGLCLERSLDLVVGILGILKAGGAYVPLDPAYPQKRLAYMIEDAGLQIVVGTKEPVATFPETAGQILLDAHRELLEGLPDTDLEPIANGANLAYAIYTSGSTGRPKGTLVSHGHVARLFASTQAWFDFGERDVWALFHSYAFDFSVWEVWGALLYGGRLVIVPYDVSRSPDLFLNLLTRERVTVLNQTPSAFAQLAKADEERAGVSTDLRLVIFGGEALDPAGLAPWFARHGDERPQLINMYGITETTVHVTYRRLRAADTRGELRSVIGVHIPDLSLAVMDPELQPAPIGVPGELVVGGAGLSRGYLGRPELTAERFVPDPVSGCWGSRLYRSGDLGRFLPHGDVEYLGRIDQQVKIRGFRIEPGEIEAALVALTGVREAVVMVREDGMGSPRLVAYAVVDAGSAADIATVRENLSGRLPDFMVPWTVVFLDALPLNANAKVDRLALPEPDWRHLGASKEFSAPETRKEKVLAGVWAEVLGVERAGAHDNFFHLGGDSIRSIVVSSRAKQMGVVFSIQQLFGHPVLRDLARVAEERDSSAPGSGWNEPFELLIEADRARLPEGVEDAYPLTSLQAGMLYHSELAPESAVYHDLFSFQLRGRYDAELLATTLEQVARRHPVLRTSFDLTGFSEPLQLVHRQAEVPLATEDLRHLTVEEGRRIALEWLDREAFQPFDWSHAPLARFQIHRFDDSSFQFTLSFHHAIFDGWSVASLLTELFRRYLSLLDDATFPEEAPPSATLHEFVYLERSALASAEARDFWRQHLDGSPLIRLPRRRAEGGTTDRRGGHFVTPLPLDLSNGLKRAARLVSLPIKSVLMGVHFRILGLLSGRTDVVSGVVSNGRPERPDGEQAIGLFLNTLPLRMTLPGGTWSDLAHAAFELERSSLPFRRFPLSELQQLEGGRTLFEIAFSYLNFHIYDSLSQLTGLELLSREGYEETNLSLITQFQLSGDSQILLTLSYQMAEHDREELEEVARRYLSALEGMAASPQAPCDTWGLFTEAERAQLLAWNRTAHPMRLPLRVHEIFEAQAERTPEATAAEMDAEQLTYRGLDHRAGRLARRLRAARVGPDDPVGMCLERSLAVPVAVLGILKAGGAYLPLDPAYPTERLAAMAEDAGLRWLVCEETTRGLLPAGLRERCQVLILGPAGEIDGDAAGESGPTTPVSVASENLAYVLYTSGSTGRPKGVAMPHGPLANLIDWQIQATTAPGPLRTAQFSALSFDASFHEMFTTWAQGGTLVLLSEAVRHDVGSLLHLLAERSIEQLFLPFVALQQVADEAAASGVLPTALREVITAGEQLQATAAVRELFRRLPGCRLVNAYGPTETHVVTAFTLPESPDTWPTLPPIGQPIANLWARVLDASLQPVLPGVPGEVSFGGAGLARGYLGRPDLTAERFLPDPQATEPGARVYRTGDLARYLPDGGIEFLGRTDQQVKVRGFRVEPGEIEAVLALHPEVREAAVVVREVSGPGDRRLVGYVVPRGHSAAEAGDALTGELRTFLAGRLPEHMVPWAFVLLEAFPLTPSGKLDRRSLPAPGAARRLGADLAPPRGPVEEIVAAIWTEVLGCGPVGIHESFFELGGHSLLATRVMSRVRAAFGIDIPLRALFDSPTVADLAARIEAALRAGTARPAAPLVPLAPTRRQEPLPSSFAQQRLWFIDQLAPGTPLYSIPVALHVEGPLDPGVLALCLGEIVRRHEVLRTVFAAPEGESPVQVIRPAAPFALPVVDLSDLPETRRKAVALDLAREEAGRPFDLSRGPLLRGVLLRLAEGGHITALTMHHIVSDGWSMGILIREMGALYPAFREGKPSPLPELPVQYADFAVWQHGWLDQEALEGLVEHWRRRLAGAPPQLDLPGARPRPAALSPRGAARHRHFPAPLLEQLRALGRRESATLFMTLLAPLQALLHSRTGATDLVVGTDVAGRDRRETEGLIGFFINQLPLRTDLSGDPTLRELLGRVRDTALEAYAHQDLPFDHLVEALRVKPSLQLSPVFQVKLVLQNVHQERLDLPGLTLRPVPLDISPAQLDLHWGVAEVGENLWVTLTYSTDLYDEPLIDRLLDQYEAWFRAFVERPEARLGEVTAEHARAERALRAERDLELKSMGFGRLRNLRRQAEAQGNVQEREV